MRSAIASAVSRGSSPSPRSSSTVTSPEVYTLARGMILVGPFLSQTQTSSIDPGRRVVWPAAGPWRSSWLREVRGVLGEHAVAKQREDRRVLALQPELEIGLELVEIVEVTHAVESSPAGSPGPWARAARPRPTRARAAARLRPAPRGAPRARRRGRTACASPRRRSRSHGSAWHSTAVSATTSASPTGTRSSSSPKTIPADMLAARDPSGRMTVSRPAVTR